MAGRTGSGATGCQASREARARARADAIRAAELSGGSAVSSRRSDPFDAGEVARAGDDEAPGTALGDAEWFAVEAVAEEDAAGVGEGDRDGIGTGDDADEAHLGGRVGEREQVGTPDARPVGLRQVAAFDATQVAEVGRARQTGEVGRSEGTRSGDEAVDA